MLRKKSYLIVGLIFILTATIIIACSLYEKHPYIELIESNPQNSSFSYTDKKETRAALVYYPKRYRNRKNLPLVVVLQGNRESAKKAEAKVNFNQRADRHGFIVVYPHKYTSTWVAFDYKKTGIDDSKFISDLIEKVTWQYSADSKRVYIAGYSDGAFMAYHLAATIPDKIAAVAAASGTATFNTISKIDAKVPVIHLHGANDNIVPFKGIKSRTGEIPSVMNVLDKWIEVNNCNKIPQIDKSKNGLIVKKWKSSDGVRDVLLYNFSEGKHNWPETPIAAEGIITEFFYSYPQKKYKLQLKGVNSGDILKLGAKLKLSAELLFNEKIDKIEFLANNKKIAEALATPYSIDWQAKEVKKYNFSVKALTRSGEILYAINPAEIQVLPSAENIALNAKVYAFSSEGGNLEAEKAIDGKLETRWSSLSFDPQWITVDLKRAREVTGVTLFWEKAHASKYEIQLSNDNKSWETVYKNDKSKGKIENINFDPKHARYVRMLGTKRATPWGFSLWEFMVHDKK